MKTVWKAAIVNVSALTGFLIVALVLPAETPDKVFLPACLGVLIVLNVVVFVVPRFRKRPENGTMSGPVSNARLALLGLLFLLSLALTWLVMRGH